MYNIDDLRLKSLRILAEASYFLLMEAKRDLVECLEELERQGVTLEDLEAWEAEEKRGRYNPNQPRVPRGNPDGGQWTDGTRSGGGVEQPAPDSESDKEWETALEIIIQVTPIGRISNAWKLFKIAKKYKKVKWKFGKHKSHVKWRNRIDKRQWTPEEIEETISKGTRYPAKNEITGGDATLYKYKNKYVIIDNKTGEIIQISGENYDHPSLPGSKTLNYFF
jgi:hypothetical protein